MAGIATPTSRCFHSPAELSIPAVLLHLMFSLTDVVHCGKLFIIFSPTSHSILVSLQSFIFLTIATSGMESEMRNLCIIHWQIIIQHIYILLYWCLLILNAYITYIYMYSIMSWPAQWKNTINICHPGVKRYSSNCIQNMSPTTSLVLLLNFCSSLQQVTEINICTNNKHFIRHFH